MKKILAFLKKIFQRARFYANTYVKPAIAVVEKIKQIMDGPVVPIITGLIPGGTDDTIAKLITEWLPILLKQLRLVDCMNETDPNKVIECAVLNMRTLEPDAKKAVLHSLATLLVKKISGGKVDWSTSIYLTEGIYKGDITV